MGLYHIQIKPGRAEEAITVAASSGISFTRVTHDENGVHHYFKRPKQNRELAITITKDKDGKEFIRMAITPICTIFGKALEAAGLTIPFQFKEPNKPVQPTSLRSAADR